MHQTYSIAGMHCSSCTGKVAAALGRVPGVENANVSLDPPVAQVEMRAPIPTEKLAEAVAGAGEYRLSELNRRAVEVSSSAASA